MKEKRLKILHFMKISLILTSLLLCLSLVHLEDTNAASETVVKVDPSIIFAHIGEAFTVNITIENVENLYGVEVALYWNSSILKVARTDVRLGKEDYPDGVLYPPVYKNETFMEGKYLLYGLSTQPAPSFNGSGTIVRITFNVTSLGTCDLNLETKLASNIIPPGGTAVEEIAHKTVNGFFGPIKLSAYPKRVTIGEGVNISGIIATAQANVTVSIFYRLDEETEWHMLETKTDEQGSYYYMWVPSKSGNYYLKAGAFILGNEETSPIISVNVSESQHPPWPYIILSLIMVVLAIAILLMRRRRRVKK